MGSEWLRLSLPTSWVPATHRLLPGGEDRLGRAGLLPQHFAKKVMTSVLLRREQRRDVGGGGGQRAGVVQ